MAATAPPVHVVERQQPSAAHQSNRAGLLAVSGLTILAVLIHGFHPYAEDGGLYLAGIKRVLHPDLYPSWSGFTTAHLRFSLFAPMMALLVRLTHLRLATAILLVYVGTTWATLYAGWQLAVRCFTHREAWYGAVSLLALLLTVPVAGTSLMLMDPYVSARSISTPCGLFALVAALDMARAIHGGERIAARSMLLLLGSLFLASLVHPLMAADALGCVLVLATASINGRWRQWAIYGLLGGIAVLAAALLVRLSPAAPAGYMEVARTRGYWFIGAWQWYELAGLAAPLVVLAVARWRGLAAWPARLREENQEELESVLSHLATKNVARWGTEGLCLNWLAEAGLVAGALAILIALLFARAGMSSYAVARLQPLRIFQAVYVMTILTVGAALGRFVLQRRRWRWAAMMVSIGALMLLVQVELFPNSNHLELPWVSPSNGWEQAFLWIRSNTPRSAVVALDADYITERGEDAQNFRAIAERSALPDFSKDGGVASIAPDLTADWLKGKAVQKGLDRSTDDERLRALRNAGAEWMILSGDAATHLHCDYVNVAAKVCRIPRGAEPGAGAVLSVNVAHATEQIASRH